MMWLWIIGVIVVVFGFVVFRGAPYLPSQRRLIRQAFTRLYPLGSGDVLIDIGSGDGIVLREAAKLGARAVGYELNPLLVFISRWLSRHFKQVSIRLADAWTTPLPDDTTVMYIFGVTRDAKRVVNVAQREANRLKRSLYVISYGIVLPGMKADKQDGAYYLYTFYCLQ